MLTKPPSCGSLCSGKILELVLQMCPQFTLTSKMLTFCFFQFEHKLSNWFQCNILLNTGISGIKTENYWSMIKWPFSAWDTLFLFRIGKTELSEEYNKV